MKFVFASKLLVVAKEILRRWRRDYRHNSDLFLCPSKDLAHPCSRDGFVLDGKKALRPYQTRQIVLRQKPDFVVLRDVLQDATNGKRVAAAAERFAAGKCLLMARIGNLNSTGSGRLTLPPAAIMFLAIPNANNPSCH